MTLKNDALKLSSFAMYDFLPPKNTTVYAIGDRLVFGVVLTVIAAEN